MDAPRALVFLPLVKENEALGTRLKFPRCKVGRTYAQSIAFFITGHSGMLVNARGKIDQCRPAPPKNKAAINDVRYRCLKLLVEVFVKVTIGLF